MQHFGHVVTLWLLASGTAVILLHSLWSGNLRTAEAGEGLGMVQLDGSLDAPDFTLATVEGKKIRLRDFKGKVVLLNFWATRYGVRGTPTTYLINRAGKVIGITLGAQHWTRDAAKKRIRQLLRNAS